MAAAAAGLRGIATHAGSAAPGAAHHHGSPSDLDAADIDAEVAAALAGGLSASGSEADLNSSCGEEAATALSLVGEGLAAVPPDLAACFPALQRLCLHGNSIASVAGLGGLTALRELNLSSNSISSLPDGAFSGLPSLTSLNLASNCLASLGAGALAGLPRLRRLALAHNGLASLAGLAPLCGGPLEQLDLRDNSLASLAELSVLAGLPRLAELQLAGGAPGGRGSALAFLPCIAQCDYGTSAASGIPVTPAPPCPDHATCRQPVGGPPAVPPGGGGRAAAAESAGQAAGQPLPGDAVLGRPAAAGVPAAALAGSGGWWRAAAAAACSSGSRTWQPSGGRSAGCPAPCRARAAGRQRAGSGAPAADTAGAGFICWQWQRAAAGPRRCHQQRA